MALNTRQRVLLYFVQKHGKPVRSTELMKWLFLFGQQEKKDANHFDFVPYKFGPFSFEATQNIRISLAAYLDLGDDGVCVRSGSEYEVTGATLKLGNSERALADTIYRECCSLTLDQLLKSVYGAYPWYASRSELLPAQIPERAEIAIYTVGYEGRSVDSFFDHLMKSGLHGIIDVRRNAYSHKYGFSGHSLQEISTKLDFSYVHIPALGIASELRKDVSSSSNLSDLFSNYEKDLVSKSEAIDESIRELKRLPSALLCFEADSTFCHRGRLAKSIAKKTGLQIVHL